ncbi:helix-turn-helix domain-containing protein [Evansella sp. AB-rgal1]|uniref:helix-turn-helix domain-containing protein n=1 Tax=Evansella sp. AB-rgal1 TaxID=3242696 RepID=UPI00359E6646
MSELGARLKAAREEKGYSLEELQVKTKIQKRYLIAIEEGDFSRLPGDFYARAFVKSYADVVGIPAEVLFEEHRDELPQSKKEHAEIPPRVNRSRPKLVKKRSKLASLVPTLIAVIFVLAIIGGFWYYYQSLDSNNTGVTREEAQSGANVDLSGSEIEDNDELNEDEDENEPVEDEPEREPDPEPEPEPELTFNRVEGNTTYFTLSNADVIEMRMEFTGASWISIPVIGYQNTYQSGDEFSTEFEEEEVTFHLGNSGNTVIFIKDHQVEYQIPNNVQYIVVTLAENGEQEE